MSSIKRAVINIAVILLNIAYLPFKLFKTKRKITYISRQSNTPSIDFIYLVKKMEEMDKGVTQVVLTKKIEKGIINKIKYGFHILAQMYHIATAKVVVVDTYVIPVSVLKHKKNLKIVQIWHAMGAVKQFGYQSLGKVEGSSKVVADAMKMHKNYDLVTCTSSVTAKIYSEAFNTPVEKIQVLGMPRVDEILGDNKNTQILKQNPKYKNKKTILYLPTFRKNKNIDLKNIIKKIDTKKYNLIIRLHPLDNTIVDKKYIAKGDFTTYDFMKFADYIITDYSATAIEASLLMKPLFLYVYDIDEYNVTRGLNISLTEELKDATYKDIESILEVIKNDNYNYDALRMFRDKYVETHNINNTESICNKLIEYLNS